MNINRIAAALIAAPMLCATLAACGGGDSGASADNSKAGSNDSSAGQGDSVPDRPRCGMFTPALKNLDPAAELLGSNAQFNSDLGPDCQTSDSIALNVDLDLSGEAPDPDHVEPGQNGWDFQFINELEGAYRFEKKIREGEWFECYFLGTSKSGEELTAEEVTRLTDFCVEARGIAEAAPAQPEGW